MWSMHEWVRRAPRRALWMTLTTRVLIMLLPIAVARAEETQVIDPSPRSLGMGGAQSGVAWGDPWAWGNAASLAGVSGVRWEHDRADLVPDLQKGTRRSSERLLLGACGLAVLVSGYPRGLGGDRIEYAPVVVRDLSGTPIGTARPEETVRATGVAASLPRAADALAELLGLSFRLAPRFDLSVGVQGKRTRLQRAAVPPTEPVELSSHDFGLQSRVSPFAFLPRGDRGAPLWRRVVVFDIGAGGSLINIEDASVVIPDEDQRLHVTQVQRAGIASRIGVRWPDALESPAGNGLLEGLQPLVAMTFAADRERAQVSGRHWFVSHLGLELSIANVIALRAGRWSDRGGRVEGPTRGIGLGIPLGPWAGVRVERSTVPQADGLKNRATTGWGAWCDLMRVVRDGRRLLKTSTRGGSS